MNEELNNVWTALSLGLITRKESQDRLVDIYNIEDSHLTMEVKILEDQMKSFK